MTNWVRDLFSTDGFVPRWDCGQWTDTHATVHILADLGVWTAYFTIPALLVYFVIRRTDIPYRGLFWLFGAFILACGTTHLMEAIIFYVPVYRLAGFIKVLTALVSWATVVALVPIVPRAMTLRSPMALEKEVGERKIAEEALRKLHAELETKVQERAGALERANQALRDEIEVRKRVEEDLWAQRERLRITLASIGDGVIVTDAQGHIVSLNRVAEELTGWNHFEAEGKPIDDVFDILDEQTRQRTVSPVSAALGQASPDDGVHQTVLRARDGSERAIDDRAAPIRDDYSALLGAVLVFRDVTERKRNENISRFLADASASLATLVDHKTTLQKLAQLAVPFFADWCLVDMIDGNGNPQRLAIAHADPEKQKWGQELAIRFPEELNAHYRVLNILRTGKSEIVPDISTSLAHSFHNADLLESLRKLGLRSFICVALTVRERTLGTITFITADSGRTYSEQDLAVAEDLAHRASVAMDNAMLYLELREGDRRKDEFLAMLAHELRNPLAPMRNALQIFRMRGAEPGTIERAREMMERQLHHMIRLVDDLLDVSRIMRGRVELRKERVELGAVIARAVETAQAMIDAQELDLDINLPPGPVWLEADLIRMAQVVSNLLTNAAKYTEKNGHIWIDARIEDKEVLIRVRDTGIGIASEMLPRVFDLFVQADRSIERSQGGLGIGLTLVKKLTEMHGGSVCARSPGIGKGSEFIIRLPILLDAPPALTTSPHTLSRDLPKRKIVVVDDNIDAAETLAMLLRLWGQDVRIAHDGEAALGLVQAYHPDLIFLDIGLPRLNGYQVAEHLRREPGFAKTFLVAMTGYGQAEDRLRSKEAGFDRHLTKPVEPEVLQELLGTHV